jgi:hypothetical protein
LLTALHEDVRALRALLEARQTAPAPRAAVVAALAAAVGGRPFTSAEVVALTTSVPELAATLEAAWLDSSRQIGKALAALEGVPVGGLRVVRLGERAGAAVWRIVVS